MSQKGRAFSLCKIPVEIARTIHCETSIPLVVLVGNSNAPRCSYAPPPSKIVDYHILVLVVSIHSTLRANLEFLKRPRRNYFSTSRILTCDNLFLRCRKF